MRELAPGVWHWEARHPEWSPGEEWDELVSSYAIDDGERLLLFDPLRGSDRDRGARSRREERPVEHVLATHGGPMDRAALERALA